MEFSKKTIEMSKELRKTKNALFVDTSRKLKRMERLLDEALYAIPDYDRNASLIRRIERELDIGIDDE